MSAPPSRLDERACPGWLRGLVWAYAALIAVGLAGYAATSAPSPPTDAYPVHTRARAETDLARIGAGARVRASSHYAHAHRHPLFAIDGEPHALPKETWEPHPSDPAPWLELLLAQASDVREVRLELVGDATSLRALECYRGETLVATEAVSDNPRLRVRLAVACADVDRLRVRFAPAPADAVVGVVELVALGVAR